MNADVKQQENKYFNKMKVHTNKIHFKLKNEMRRFLKKKISNIKLFKNHSLFKKEMITPYTNIRTISVCQIRAIKSSQGKYRKKCVFVYYCVIRGTKKAKRCVLLYHLKGKRKFVLPFIVCDSLCEHLIKNNVDMVKIGLFRIIYHY